jgi:hypothetical protein
MCRASIAAPLLYEVFISIWMIMNNTSHVWG